MSGKPKARPILMSAPMVRALLAGTKTQTRRAISPQPELNDNVGFIWKGHMYGRGLDEDHIVSRRNFTAACPYGNAGDLLYVKEAWRTAKSLDDLDGTKIASKCLDAGYREPWTPTKFEADGQDCSRWHGFGDAHTPAIPGRYRHARFMPRWASRLTLRITEVRVQRLQVISEADARAEGVDEPSLSDRAGERFRNMRPWPDLYRPMYSLLWEDINGAGSWGANPWVWALSFEVQKKNVGQLLEVA